MFPVHSPKIERIELAARGDVRRAKLYYLRDRVGKRARVRERRYIGPEETVEPGLMHEPAGPTDADGLTAEETVLEQDAASRGRPMSPGRTPRRKLRLRSARAPAGRPLRPSRQARPLPARGTQTSHRESATGERRGQGGGAGDGCR